MAISSYKQFLQIKFRHAYLTRRVMTNVMVQPSTETLRILNKYQMVYRLDSGVFTILYPDDPVKPKYREAIADAMGDEGMVFSMVSMIPGFTYVTDIPMEFRGPLVFSSTDVTMNDDVAVFVTQTPEEPPSTIGAEGIIIIHKTPLFNSDYTLNITNYAVELDTRQIHWDYNIIDRTGIDLKNTMVTNGKGIEFQPPVLEKLPNNQEAMVYSSGSYEFAFTERPEHRFDLVELNGTGSEDDNMTTTQTKTIYKGLPVPPGNQILTKQVDGQPYIYSAIYVYV